MGVSVRFIIEAACFDPRPGQGAAFTKQIDVSKGEEIFQIASCIMAKVNLYCQPKIGILGSRGFWVLL